MLNINLDGEAEQYLIEILAHEKTNSGELIKQLLHDRWKSLQSPQTVLERMGGYPDQLFEGASDLSDRDTRKQAIQVKIQEHYQRSQQ